MLDVSLNGPAYHHGSFVQGCVIAVGGVILYSWIGGPELTVASAVFTCVYGGVTEYLN